MASMLRRSSQTFVTSPMPSPSSRSMNGSCLQADTHSRPFERPLSTRSRHCLSEQRTLQDLTCVIFQVCRGPASTRARGLACHHLCACSSVLELASLAASHLPTQTFLLTAFS